MASLKKLKGDPLEQLEAICGYFANNRARMQYDIYLREGYPLATGVIEGACHHLVKDRMERSGMRWTLEGARSMLDVRACFQSDYWNYFHTTRKIELSKETHPHRALIESYCPLSLTI